MTKVKELSELDKSIAKQSYQGNMGIVGVNEKLLFPLVSCKEEVYHSIGKYYVFRNNPALAVGMLGHGEFNDDFDKNKSHILIYVEDKTKFAKARRINQVLKLLAKKQKLKNPKVYIIKDSNAIMIKPDQWYFRNPVAMSGFLTFARGASKTDFVFNTLANFITKIIKFHKKSYLADGEQLGLAKSNENLKGFLNKTLGIFDLKPRAAYSLGKPGEDIPYDGIVNYGEYEYDSIKDGLYSNYDSSYDYDGDDDSCGCSYCGDY